MKLERKQIKLAGYVGYRMVDAAILAERVAVHHSWFDEGWTISDPVTGRCYTYRVFETERKALGVARKCMRLFGANPLKGSVLDERSDRFTRKPKNYDAIKKFFTESVR